MTSMLRRTVPRLCALNAGIGYCLRAAFWFLLVGGAVCAFPLLAGADIADATSDRGAREEAMRAIPWRQLTPERRSAAQFVVNHTSIYRRLPTRVIDCDPELFTFLVQHPEVVIDIWRVMGLSQVALKPVGQAMQPDGSAVARQTGMPDLPCYRGTDGAGTTGTVRFLHADWGPNARNLAVIYADGSYEGKALVAPIKARSLMLLRSGAIQETNGRHYVTVRVDSFVHIEQLGIELIAKTIQPWISKTAEQNFIETLSFVSNFSRTAEQNPQGIERLAARLPTIDEPTRNALVALSFRTAERYAQHRFPGHTATTLVARRVDAAHPDATWIGPASDSPLAQ